MRIGVVAPGSRIEPIVAERVKAITADRYPRRDVDIQFHPQCFLDSGHFAGDDAIRMEALAEFANDPRFDALWFARGGYGSCRLIERLLPKLSGVAREKAYLGYSDAGIILGGLYNDGFARLAHGPMVTDISRAGGEAAIVRALAYLVDGAADTLEPTVTAATKTAAFNIAILSSLIGTPFQPDLTDHVLMLEEVGEHMYRIDRSLFHITGNPAIRNVAGIKLGRCSDIIPNDPDFCQSEEEITRHWCGVAGIPYLGRADIGHDVDNKIVPFGGLSPG
ncbi:MAG: LD-carboxypeptidase [Alphaproteobacteria bacterium]|nr:LD-carboxypeptidase [Alphaproteobacteria bacterium]